MECLFIGGGFSALLTSARLREVGVESIRIVERGADVGGTWYWNRYPGVACDVVAYDYLPLLDEMNYVPTHHYAQGHEIYAYCQEIAKRLEPFGCRIVAVRNGKNELSQTNVEMIPTPEEAVSEADHVVIGLPLTEKTHHIVNDRLMKLMKPGAHLVNIARGDIVDQEALFENLESGQISRASLDVVTPEPLPEGHWLYTHPRVKLSAHISWASPDFLDQLHDLFSSNLKKWLSGLPLDGLVDIKKGY